MVDKIDPENQDLLTISRDEFFEENHVSLEELESGIYRDIDNAITAVLPEHSFVRKENEYFYSLKFNGDSFVEMAFEVNAQLEEGGILPSPDMLRFAIASEWEWKFPEIGFSNLTKDQLVQNSAELFIKITAYLAVKHKDLADHQGNRETLTNLDEYNSFLLLENYKRKTSQASSLETNGEDWEELKHFVRKGIWVFVIFIVLFLFYVFSL